MGRLRFMARFLLGLGGYVGMVFARKWQTGTVSFRKASPKQQGFLRQDLMSSIRALRYDAISEKAELPPRP
jgi:hypothetical protein